LLEESIDRDLKMLEINSEELRKFSLDVAMNLATCNKILKGRPYETISVGIIVYATRMLQYPITIKKISKVTEIPERIINKIFITLKSALVNHKVSKPTPDIFITNIIDKLKILDMKIPSLYIVKELTEKNLIGGEHSATVAAVAVKIACELN